MAQKKSIDEIWKELNARQPARRPAAPGHTGSAAGSKSSSLTVPGLGTVTRVAPPPKPTLPLGSQVEDVPLGVAASQHKSNHYDPTQAGISPEQLATYMSTIQRLVNCLSDQDRGTRRQAVTTLQAKLVSADVSTPAVTPSMLQALASGPLLYPLLNLLKDVVEKCRVVSMELWSHIVTTVPDLSAILPALLPELARRMGHLPVQESAEEVRLSLVQLVGTAAGRAATQQLLPALPDLLLILCRAQEDSYHEIKKAGAAAIVSLSARVPGAAMAAHTGKLVAALIANLQHPHSRVRTSVLEALDALVLADALPAGSVQAVVAPGLRHVAYDRAPAVREALFACLASWLGAPNTSHTSMPSTSPAAAEVGQPVTAAAAAQGGEASAVGGSSEARMRQGLGPEQMTELLPILLIGVSDPQPSIASHTLQLVENVGEAHQLRSTSSSTEVTTAAEPMQVDGTAAATADVAADKDVDMEQAAAAGVDASADVAAQVAACHLGPPYSGRPGAGARAMARVLLPSLLPPVIADTTSWTTAQRSAAVRTLHTLLVLAEDAVQAHLPSLLPALCSAVGDEDVDVAQGVVRCVHVVGAYVQPSRWLPLMLDQLVNTRLSAGARANALVVLAALMHAAGTAQQVLSTSSLESLALTLASDDLRAALLQASSTTQAAHTVAAPAAGNSREAAATRAQLLAVCTNLATWQGPACAAVSRPLCTLLLALWGAEPDPPPNPTVAAAAAGMSVVPGSVSPRAAVDVAMQQLVGCCGGGSWEALLDQHADTLLQDVLASAGSWAPDAGSFLIFKALLLTAAPHTLERLAPRVHAALAPIMCDHDGGSPTLRLALLQLMEYALDDPNNRGVGLAGEQHALLLLQSVLLPPLTWRAGKTAAAIRFAAMTALATALRRGLLPCKALLRLINDGTLLPLLAQELDEDWYVDVRHASCYVAQQLLLLVGPRLGHEPRRTLYVELLKRLDDSSNTVRVAACQALQAFCTTMPADYCETNAGYLAAGVIIHMDDADTQVQEAACSVLEALGQVKPAVVRTEVHKVRDRFRNKHCCDRVLASLPIT